MGDVLRFQKQRPRRRPPKAHKGLFGRIVLAMLAGAGVAWVAYSYIGAPMIGCDIKGNISVNTGERIYHVPGQEYYLQTRIDVLKGERWFCSEQAARAAGWRRSRV